MSFTKRKTLFLLVLWTTIQDCFHFQEMNYCIHVHVHLHTHTHTDVGKWRSDGCYSIFKKICITINLRSFPFIVVDSLMLQGVSFLIYKTKSSSSLHRWHVPFSFSFSFSLLCCNLLFYLTQIGSEPSLITYIPRLSHLFVSIIVSQYNPYKILYQIIL